MATRKGLGPLQFFDPNDGLVEFQNSMEFYQFLPGYVAQHYPGLLNKKAEVLQF